MNIYSTVATILLGLLTSFFIYSFILRPLILKPLCLIESNTCLRMGYYSYNNSALIQMRNSGIWVWYNGDKAFIYGQPVGQICKKPFEPAYSINTKTGLKEGYACVMSLEDVINFYTSKGIKMNYVLKRASDNLDVYTVLNILNDEGVIQL